MLVTCLMGAEQKEIKSQHPFIFTSLLSCTGFLAEKAFKVLLIIKRERLAILSNIFLYKISHDVNLLSTPQYSVC